MLDKKPKTKRNGDVIEGAFDLIYSKERKDINIEEQKPQRGSAMGAYKNMAGKCRGSCPFNFFLNSRRLGEPVTAGSRDELIQWVSWSTFFLKILNNIVYY